MGSDIRRAGHEVLIGRIQMPDVPALHDQEDDPVDARNDDIERERSTQVSVLSPYRTASMVMVAVGGGVEGVVERYNNHKKP
jgi:hypothetical protein